MLDSDIDDRLYHAPISKQFSLDNISHVKDPVRVEIEQVEEFSRRGRGGNYFFGALRKLFLTEIRELIKRIMAR